MDNMYGVFIVLMIGSAAASLFGFVEWLLIMYFKAKKYKVRHAHFFLLYDIFKPLQLYFAQPLLTFVGLLFG